MNIKYLISKSIITKLYTEGLITKDEFVRIDERNRISFCEEGSNPSEIDG